MPTDEELLEAWRGGDPRAGESLFQRHFEAVRRFFVNKVGNVAEDLIQRTFVGCVEAKERFAGRSSFRTFLFAIANNVLREHFRRGRRVAGEIDFEAVSVQDLDAGPVTLALRHEEQRLLLAALREIPVDLQVVLELYYWEQLNGREIGEVVGIPEDTVRSRLRRAKDRVLAAMERLASSKAVLESTTRGLEKWARGVHGGAIA